MDALRINISFSSGDSEFFLIQYVGVDRSHVKSECSMVPERIFG